jgi:hypothetical protein
MSEPARFSPGRMWSLWDMIDLRLRDFIYATDMMAIAKCRADTARQDIPLTDQQIEHIKNNLARISFYCEVFEMRTAQYRINILNEIMGPIYYGENLSREIGELLNAIQFDSQDEYFCHYDKSRVSYIRDAEEEWAEVFHAFPSAKGEIISGLDCYSLGHRDAAVFHMARVGEIGLIAIGREMGVKSVRGGSVPIDYGTWGDVPKAIEPRVEEIRKQPNGPNKEAALKFYHSVLSDLRAIQNLYRDPTMHLRSEYDDGEAQSSIFRAKSLMHMLSTKIDENVGASIQWGFAS